MYEFSFNNLKKAVVLKKKIYNSIIFCYQIVNKHVKIWTSFFFSFYWPDLVHTIKPIFFDKKGGQNWKRKIINIFCLTVGKIKVVQYGKNLQMHEIIFIRNL